MADNIQNVPVPRGVWVDLYAATGITVGEPIAIENIGACEVKLAVSATQPARDTTAFNILNRDGEILRNSQGDAGAWVYSNNVNGMVAVREISVANGFYPENIDITLVGDVLAPDVVGLKNAANVRIDPATDGSVIAVTTALTAVTTTEDAPSVDGQKGIAAMAVSNDALADLVSADGDETRISTDKKGVVYVRDEAALIQLVSIDDELVIANSELADQTIELQAISTNFDDITTTEDTDSADGQKGIPAMAVANEAQLELVDADGDETRIATDKKGAQYTRDDALLAAFNSVVAGVVDPLNTSVVVPTVASPYVGDWSLNDTYPNVMVTMACDEPGTLFFEFYDRDGTTPTLSTPATSRFPVTGFQYDNPPFNEFHQATKGPRWFRVRFEPDTDPTVFRMNSYFVVKSEGNLPINQMISGDQDSIVTRSIPEGNLLDDDLNPTTDYGQVGVLPNNSLSVGLAPKIIFKETISLPTGSPIVIDPLLNTEPNTYDSGWIPASAYHSQLFHANLNGTADVFLMNAPDDQGTNFIGGDFPFDTTDAFGPTVGGAMFQQAYFRVIITNTSGVTVEGEIESEGHFTALGPILIGLGAPIFDFFTAPLMQAVSKGKAPSGLYTATRNGGASEALSIPALVGSGAAGQVKESSWFYWPDYVGIFTTVKSDGNGVIKVEFSSDDVPVALDGTPLATLPVSDGNPIVVDYAVPGLSVTRGIPTRGLWGRITWTIGSLGATELNVETDMRVGTWMPVMQEVRERIKANNLAVLVKSVNIKSGDVEGNAVLPLQLDGLTTQTVLLDLATIDPTDYGFPIGTVLKYVAETFDLSSTNAGYIEGRYAISDAGDAKVRRSIARRSAGAGVTYEGRQYTPQITPEFESTVRLDYSQGAGVVAVTGRIDGYLTEAVV